ncbi:unnamed protein product [Peniophora sp. CBMAI 1063]|nr:unnamed protein product [Peniophora sp. CBMAI 1063]
MSNILIQATEVLDHIFDEIDRREDLLSFALTCARLRDIIIASHLPYRRVVISMYFQPFFDLIKARQDLAGRVRELTLVNLHPQVVVPRAHAFRRDFPASRLLFASGYDDEFLYNGNYETRARLPFDIRTTLDDALMYLPRLRCLQFRGDTGKLPLERIITTHHDLLEGFSLDGSYLVRAPGDTPFPLLTSDLWTMAGLRTLELSMTLNFSYWNPFCDVLGRSPMLETLSVPLFSHSIDDGLHHIPQLSYLRHVSVHNLARDGDDVISQRIYDFLNGHRSIEELSWQSSVSVVPLRVPRLPTLKRMLNMSHVHALACRPSDRSNRRVLTKTLETISLAMIFLRNDDPALEWTWKTVCLAFPTSLRSLHIVHTAFESYAMLDALCRSFPGLEELYLPDQGSPYRIQVAEAVARTYQSHHPLQISMVNRCPPITEIMERFPRLSSVAGVDIGMDVQTQRMRAYHTSTTGTIPTYINMGMFHDVVRSLVSLRERYPRLRSVNGWHLDTDLAREVIMGVHPGSMTYRDGIGVQVVLTRESICVRYSGPSSGSLPVPLQFNRPRPIPRTYYRNGY